MPLMVRQYDNNTSISNEKLTQVTLTAGLTSAKGAYVQLTAATTLQQANYFIINPHDPNVSQEYFIDIAIGAASSEVIQIPDIQYHLNIVANSHVPIYIKFGCEIPKGSRIAARVSSETNTDTIDVDVILQGF